MNQSPVRILVSPYPFKGTFTSAEAAAAIEEVLGEHSTSLQPTLLPLGDGGMGTVAALVTGRGGTYRSCIGRNALAEETTMRWGRLPGNEGVVEVAAAVALADVPPDRRDPSRRTTEGVGGMIADAVRNGVGKLYVGLGDSSTHDCGVGMAAALGVRFLDRNGRELAPVGASLPDIHHIDMSSLPDALRSLPVTGLCDVPITLTGPDGPARRFSRQKGADAAMIDLLEEGSRRFAEVVRRDLGRDVLKVPGAGAAGGIGAGLLAFFNADLVEGPEFILDAIHFDERLGEADMVITGEGRVDEQTLLGKGTAHVARRAAEYGVPCVILAGGLRGEKQLLERKLRARIYVVGRGNGTDGTRRERGAVLRENLADLLPELLNGEPAEE